MATMNKEDVFSKVQAALVDALGVDEDEVSPRRRLVGDLGAESIDFLDIVFRLEKAFDIKIPRGELFPEDILTNAQYVQNGKVTAEGLEQLKKRMPFADLTAFSANPVVKDFGNLLTVQDMCRYVESKVAAEATTPRKHDAAAWQVGSERDSPVERSRTFAHALVLDRSIHRVRKWPRAPRPSRTSRWPKSTCTTTFPARR